MGSDYYSLEETAKILNIATAELNRLRERGELRAFRDGMNWKFRKKDIHDYYAKVKGQSQTPSENDSDALDSDKAANNKPTPIDTDPFDALVEDGIAESELVAAPGSSGMLAKKSDAKPQADDDLSLAVDDFLALEDDGLTLAKDDELTLAKDEKNTNSELALANNDNLSLAKEDDDLLAGDGLTLANDDLSLAKDDDMSIAKDDGLSLANGYDIKKPKEELVLGTGSALDLSALEDDDDEVLSLNAAKNGGKSGGDGLSLADDSGLSLLEMDDKPAQEKPITLAKRKSDSDIGLELGEDDDIISIANDEYDVAGEDADIAADKSPSDGDFDLEPAFTAFDDDSDSASQAIALEGSASTETPAFDSFSGGVDSFGGFGDTSNNGFAAPPAGQPANVGAQAQPFGGGDGALPGTFPTTTAPTYAGPSEPVYGTGMVVTSVVCVGFLGLGVMMLFDVILNMWSWGNTFPVNSLILDTLKGMVF
jgi:excisionase family DNA binding protein